MLKAAAKAVAVMGIATKKDPECVRVVVRSPAPSQLFEATYTQLASSALQLAVCAGDACASAHRGPRNPPQPAVRPHVLCVTAWFCVR